MSILRSRVPPPRSLVRPPASLQWSQNIVNGFSSWLRDRTPSSIRRIWTLGPVVPADLPGRLGLCERADVRDIIADPDYPVELTAEDETWAGPAVLVPCARLR